MMTRILTVIDLILATLIALLTLTGLIIFAPILRLAKILQHDRTPRRPRMFTTFNMSSAGFVERGMSWRMYDQDLDGFFDKVFIFMITADVRQTLTAKNGRIVIIDAKHPFKDVAWIKNKFKLSYILFAFLYETVFISHLVWNHSIDFVRIRGPFYEGLLGLAQKILFGLPYSISVHTDWDLMFKETGRGVLTKSKTVDEMVERTNLFFADQVISFFPNQEEYLLRHWARKSRIRLSYVPCRFYELLDQVKESPAELKRQLGLPADKKILMYAGRFSTEKYVEDLVQVLAEVRASRPDTVMVLIGRGPTEPALRTLCRDRGFTDRDIIIIPYQPHEQLARYYLCADIRLAPEGGSSMREAFFSGKPVVGYKVWTVTEFIENGVTGLMVEFRNIQQFSRAVLSLLNDQRLTDTIAANALRKAHGLYAIPTVYAHRRKLYGELLKARYPYLLTDYAANGVKT